MIRAFNPIPFLLIAITLLCCTQSTVTQSSEDTHSELEKTGTTSIGWKLKKNSNLPIEQRIALYNRLKRDSINLYAFGNEYDLTIYGYTLLWDKKIDEAFEVFKLLQSEFPGSYNVYDNMGEVYLAKGDKEQSITNYQKSLELNPDNQNAIDQIERIRFPERATDKAEDLTTRFAKVFSVQAYRDDLDDLGTQLRNTHPNALKFITNDNFQKLVDEKKALISAKTTYAEFAWHCSEIVASIGCSHTSTGGFYFEWEMLPVSRRFPLSTIYINDQLLVVSNNVNDENVAVHDEVVSINDIPVSQIIGDCYKHIPAQAHIENYKRHQFNASSAGMIAYALGFPENYKIQTKRKATPVVLNNYKSKQDYVSITPKSKCPDKLCFEKLDDGKTAILTIESFVYYWWSDLTRFTDFIDTSFKDINKSGIENLIIDVRNNGGGSNHAGVHLLKYLVDKPFTYYSNSLMDEDEGVQQPFANSFKGKVYFLIDGHGNSTTGHVMSIAKELNLGTIVGEELGSNQFCTAGQVIKRLPNTRLEYYVANGTFESSATSLPDDKGILPDFFVSQSVEDYWNDVDRVRTFTLELIRKQ